MKTCFAFELEKCILIISMVWEKQMLQKCGRPSVRSLSPFKRKTGHYEPNKSFQAICCNAVTLRFEESVQD